MKTITLLLVGACLMVLNGAMSPVQADGGYTPQIPSQSTKVSPPAKGSVKTADPNYATFGKNGKLQGTYKSQQAGTQPTDK